MNGREAIKLMLDDKMVTNEALPESKTFRLALVNELYFMVDECNTAYTLSNILTMPKLWNEYTPPVYEYQMLYYNGLDRTKVGITNIWYTSKEEFYDTNGNKSLVPIRLVEESKRERV